jgi:hypothetical protein
MSRARSIGRALGADLMGSAEAGGAGALAGFVGAELASRYEWARKAWWATPAAVFLAGHVAKNVKPRLRNAGLGAVGGSGTMAFYNYKLARASQGQQPYPGAPATNGVQDSGDVDYMGTFRELSGGTGAVQEQNVARPTSSVMGLQAH